MIVLNAISAPQPSVKATLRKRVGVMLHALQHHIFVAIEVVKGAAEE
jgi:hypothetical protein